MLNHVRRAAAALAVAAAVATLACGPTTPPFTAADEAAVTKLFTDTPGYVLSGAADSWAGMFTADAPFQPANGPSVSGHDAMVAWFKALPPLESFVFGAPKVHGSGGVAYATSTYAIKFKDVPADTGKQLIVAMRNAAGKWELVAVSFNSDLPLPTPQPAKGASRAPAKAPAKAP